MYLAHCIGCGCDDMHACWDEASCEACCWLAVDYGAALGVCSCCPDDLARWEANDLTFAVPVDMTEDECCMQQRDASGRPMPAWAWPQELWCKETGESRQAHADSVAMALAADKPVPAFNRQTA